MHRSMEDTMTLATPPTRRAFLQGGGAAFFGSASLMGSTALASIDPNSFSGRTFHASHFGPFEAVVRDGKLVGINTMMELDARPTEMLTYGVMDRTYDKTRVNYPMVRKSYLEGWETGDTKPELRGKKNGCASIGTPPGHWRPRRCWIRRPTTATKQSSARLMAAGRTRACSARTCCRAVF